MSSTQPVQRREIAVAELARHNPRVQAAGVVDGLTTGLAHLRDLIVSRIHRDVEREYGVDTMIGPVSAATEVKQVVRAGIEIDVYLTVVTDAEIRRGGYVDEPADWFLDWLARLRLDTYDAPDVNRRIEMYRGLTSEECRRGFVATLQRVAPESLRAPLVLFRLIPLAAQIVAVAAFGNNSRAEQLRAEQLEILPAIGYCNDCRGRLIALGADCPHCGNPLWTFDWLRES